LHVASDGPGGMSLELPAYKGERWGFVAATRLGKRYVSYYLMAVYGDADLAGAQAPDAGQVVIQLHEARRAALPRARGVYRTQRRATACAHRGCAQGQAASIGKPQPGPYRAQPLEMRQTSRDP